MQVSPCVFLVGSFCLDVLGVSIGHVLTRIYGHRFVSVTHSLTVTHARLDLSLMRRRIYLCYGGVYRLHDRVVDERVWW